MPSVPYALVLCSLNGGANNSGGLTAAGSQTVQLSGSNTAGWTSALWQMTDYPAGFTAPAGWSTDAGGIIFYAGVTPPIFTLPAIATRWGKWMFKLTVNNGTDELGVFNPGKMIDSTTAVKTLSTKGQSTIGAGETTQFGGELKGWTGEAQAEAVAIESQLGSGVLPLTLVSTATTATTANQTIATIPIVANSGATKLDMIIVAHRTGALAEVYSVALATTYYDIGAGPVIVGTDTLSDPKAVASGTPAINSFVSGQNILIRATPWNVGSTVWTVGWQAAAAL